MKNQNNNSNMVSMKVSSLTIHPTLKELGIEPLNHLELEVNKKFGVPDEMIIADSNGQVITNWEYVKSCTATFINVCQVKINKDELLLLLATKNLRRELKPSKRILLVVKLRECLKKTGYGKEIYKQIEGDSVTHKIAKMIGSSYGTVYKYFLIERYSPEVKKRMDDGECCLKEAELIAAENRDHIKNRVKKVLEVEPGDDADTSIKKKKGKVGLSINGFAGQENFVDIDRLKKLSITKSDGTVIELKQLSGFISDSKREPFENGAEFYQFFDEKSQAFVLVTIKNL